MTTITANSASQTCTPAQRDDDRGRGRCPPRDGQPVGPRLISVYGLGLMAAGPLRADPKGAHISWHGYGHLISATSAFSR